jgi:hypothetical protein
MIGPTAGQFIKSYGWWDRLFPLEILLNPRKSNPLEKPVAFQLVKENPHSMEPGGLLPYPHESTTVPYFKQINLIQAFPFCLWSHLILSSHLILVLLRILFHSGYPINPAHISILSQCLARHLLLNVIILMTYQQNVRLPLKWCAQLLSNWLWRSRHRFSLPSLNYFILISRPKNANIVAGLPYQKQEALPSSLLLRIPISWQPHLTTYMLQSLYCYLVEK